ncbi:MAG TPA: POTRA domain-containing protein [Prolixibacteraceae bacterium]|nr:POTRA domain-containing protein [Prolixibacteraceae bacterium]HOS01256.1 POTRA domain-containing protein [Prolixibacteraceae bacterium]HOS91276.1 POTRA domain-containing protein [Prolixibacteraceae bacterium]HPL46347.1 POTRA domain-containing protein [Prolixibacteraceae bacterium]HQE53092.1 POTRA domain-containing protein [Prolixibacteraceae bacterium]
MRKTILAILFFMVVSIPAIRGQVADSSFFSVYYSSPKKLTIADIQISGIRYLDRDVLVQLSGLKVGQEVDIPGEQITTAIKKLWQQGLFSDIKITASRISGNDVWLDIYLQERPRLGEVNFSGITKSEKDDITAKVLLLKGSQVTDNQINNAQRMIKNIFLEKGFLNTEVNILQRDDTTQTNTIILDIKVDKKEKVKIQDVIIHGNEEVSDFILERSMKKTNAKKLYNFFRTKKYLDEKFREDKANLIKKYNQKGYRDAVIIRDTVYRSEKKNRVNVELWVEEGDKYYFRDINWVGNTVYPADYLNTILGIKKGDVFDQKLLNKRLTEDEDAVLNIAYQDNGYLFSQIDPVEVNIEKDSIDLEMRIYEGKQATINKIGILGNTKTHEHVARRELRTFPGDLYSKNNIIRSIRELAQLGHFDPEAIVPDVVPHPEDGTVDVNYKLEEKANDQIELSGGWGAGMFVGSVGLKFANFSARNIFNKEAWRPLPSGDGQTLSLRYQTSGQYYKTASLSFYEPWLGGKKPNSFSLSFSWSRVNFSANKYYQNYYNSPYGYGGYSPYGYGGYSPYGYGYGYGGYSPYGYGGYSPFGYSGYGSYYGGYGGYYPPYQYNYESEDKDESNDEIWETLAVGLGYGYRLSWPDDWFAVTHEVSFEHYRLQNMATYFDFLADKEGNVNGTSNNLSFRTVLSRNSVDNPLYSRKGSSFSLSLKMTPPYSWFSKTDWSDPAVLNSDKYRWIEYHKWLFKGQSFNALSRNSNLVLRTAFELGFLGYYDQNRQSPFEGFIVGGSGMSGYSYYGTDYISMRGYKDYSLSYRRNGSKMYSKFTMEMRYPVTLKPSATIYALTFLEAGNTNDLFRDYNPFKLYRSAGVGVRIYLPMFGLMGIDWGYGFDKVPWNGEAGGSNFHFVIGQQF